MAILARPEAAASPSATEMTLRSMSPSCSATQRRTEALSSACSTVLLMTDSMPSPWRCLSHAHSIDIACGENCEKWLNSACSFQRMLELLRIISRPIRSMDGQSSSPDGISGRSDRDPYSWTVSNHFDVPDRSAISVQTPPGMLGQAYQLIAIPGGPFAGDQKLKTGQVPWALNLFKSIRSRFPSSSRNAAEAAAPPRPHTA